MVVSGIQIITMETVEETTFGINGNKWTETANSFNGAITSLNAIATKYLNTNYASSARSVGSIPNNKTAESSEYWTNYKTLPKFKKADTNYLLDYNQMESLSILNINIIYLMASRVSSNPATTNCTLWTSTGHNYAYDGIAYINASGILKGNSSDTCILICCHPSSSATGNAYCWTNTYLRNGGIRPVFTLKPGIKLKGEGTSNNPYTLVK